SVKLVELALTLAVLAPGRDLLAGLVELDDAVIGGTAMAVADKNVAIGRNHDAACAVEETLRVAGHAGLAERHQHLASRAELDDDGALSVPRPIVRRPHIALVVDIEAVRLVEHVGAEAAHELAVRIELLDRVAAVRGTAVEHPDALAVAMVELDFDGPAKLAALRKLQPVVLHLVRIGRRIGIGGLGMAAIARGRPQRAGGDTDHQCHSRNVFHRTSPLWIKLNRSPGNSGSGRVLTRPNGHLQPKLNLSAHRAAGKRGSTVRA